MFYLLLDDIFFVVMDFVISSTAMQTFLHSPQYSNEDAVRTVRPTQLYVSETRALLSGENGAESVAASAAFLTIITSMQWIYIH